MLDAKISQAVSTDGQEVAGGVGKMGGKCSVSVELCQLEAASRFCYPLNVICAGG